MRDHQQKLSLKKDGKIFVIRLRKIGNEPDDILIEEFSSCLREMYGNETQLKQNLFETIFKLDEVPEKSKAWIRKHIGSLI